ncbi:MAG: LVIVD repeat-containing protein, partial [Solirubrobacteraceae bacterium]
MPDSARHRRTGPRALAAIVASAALLSLPAAAYASGNAPSRSGSVSNSTNLAGTTAVATAGAFAYAPSYGTGVLTAVNLSNPASPVVAGTSASAPSLMNSTNIAISGGDAFVVSKNRNASTTNNDDGTGNSLTILSLANPAVPTIVASLHDPTNLFGAYGIAISGSDAFIAAQGCLSGQPCPNAAVGNSFAVVNVANPNAPTLVTALHNSSLPAPWAGALDHATSVAISGNFAYVTAAYSSRLTVINIANPAAPTIVASLHDPTNLPFPVDVAVQGNYAYVADQSGASEFTVVNIANPSNPTVVGTITNSALSGAYRTKVSGDYAFVSGSSAAAMSVIDISQPTKPVIVWSDTDQAHFWRTTGLS